MNQQLVEAFAKYLESLPKDQAEQALDFVATRFTLKHDSFVCTGVITSGERLLDVIHSLLEMLPNPLQLPVMLTIIHQFSDYIASELTDEFPDRDVLVPKMQAIAKIMNSYEQIIIDRVNENAKDNTKVNAKI